jgi:hypothetical protein
MQKTDRVARNKQPPPHGNSADPWLALRSRFAPVSFSDDDFAAADRAAEKVAASASRLIPETFANLQAAWDARDDKDFPDAVKDCRAIAHDLAGLGGSLGYPIITDLARSLCRFIDVCDLEHPDAREIIGAHIAALSGVVENRMSRCREGMADAIASALDSALSKFRSQ